MIYSQRLLANAEYRDLLYKLKKAEQDRFFCRHNLEHFMDVARIARIINCEEKMGLDNDDIYLAALLHDVGRLKQYEDGTPHHKAGLPLAEKFLDAIDYPQEGRKQILAAIKGHRKEKKKEMPLTAIIRKADKLARPCFLCPAHQQCNWSEEQKNKTFQY